MSSKLLTAVTKWIAENKGYSFLTYPSASLNYYTDAYGIKRPLVYHGAPDEIAFIEALKRYVNWRLEQAENYVEITFSHDLKIIKIHLTEREYERI